MSAPQYLVEYQDIAGGRLIRLPEQADEHFDFVAPLQEATGVVIVDGSAVKSITSSAVRGWQLGLRTCRASYLGFVNCRPALVTQFNLVRGFAGPGELLSFYLPYRCNDCNTSFQVLLDAIAERSLVESMNLPVENCPTCQTPAGFDDEPSGYLFFAASTRTPSPPALAQAILARGTSAVGLAVEKALEPGLSVLWLSGHLDGARNLRRLAHGLEEDILIIGTGLTETTSSGLERFNEFLGDLPAPAYISNILPALIAPIAALPFASAKLRWVTPPWALPAELAGIDFVAGSATVTGYLAQHRQMPSREQFDTDEHTLHDTGPWGRYTLLRQIGRGGMAEVFVARQSGVGGFERTVVIKRIRPDLAANPFFVESFLEEARLAALVTSPYVVQTYDVGHGGGHFFIAMEYVKGWDLLRLLRNARALKSAPPLHGAVQLIVDVCRGLEAAHSYVDPSGTPRPVVHQDVSPDNILVSSDGWAKLSDFGIAKTLSENQQPVTPERTLIGKTSYFAPELLASTPTSPNERTDIFAAGIVLYELLTLVHPFRRTTEVQTVAALLQLKVPPPSELNSQVTPGLDRIALRALASPDQRYQSAAEMAADLEQFLVGRAQLRSSFVQWARDTTLALPDSEFTSTSGPGRHGTEQETRGTPTIQGPRHDPHQT